MLETLPRLLAWLAQNGCAAQSKTSGHGCSGYSRMRCRGQRELRSTTIG